MVDEERRKYVDFRLKNIQDKQETFEREMKETHRDLSNKIMEIPGEIKEMLKDSLKEYLTKLEFRPYGWFLNTLAAMFVGALVAKLIETILS